MKRKTRKHPHRETDYEFFHVDHRFKASGPNDENWCMRKASALPFDSGHVGLAGWFRCPRCGRRLRVLTVDIEHGYGDFQAYLPPHKLRKLARMEVRALKIAKTRARNRRRKRAPGTRGK